MNVKIGGFVKVVGKIAFWREIQTGKIYKVMKIRKCWGGELIPTDCVPCKSDRRKIDVCLGGFLIRDACHIEMEPIFCNFEETICFQCNDRLLCTIITNTTLFF